MKINENELEVLIEYGLNVYLKPYSISFSNINTQINNNFVIQGVIDYKGKQCDVFITGLIDYRENILRFYKIDGNIMYMKLNIPFMHFLKSFINNDILNINEDEINIRVNLPIQSIKIENNKLVAKIC